MPFTTKSPFKSDDFSNGLSSRNNSIVRRVTAIAVLSATLASTPLLSANAKAPLAQSTTVAETTESTTYIGQVEGTQAFAAIVTRNGKAIVYVCDSKKIAVWLKGTFVDGQLNVASKSGDTLTGTPEYATLNLLNRAPLVVKTSYSPFDDKAHFFVANSTVRGVAWAGGWITLANGRQRGNLRNDDGVVFKAPLVTTSTKTVPVPGRGTIGVVDYEKNWEKIPVTAGGGAE